MKKKNKNGEKEGKEENYIKKGRNRKLVHADKENMIKSKTKEK